MKRKLSKIISLFLALIMLLAVTGCDLLAGLIPPDVCPHFFDEGRVGTAATCVDEGEKIFECKLCGTEKTEPIAKTEHTYSTEYNYDNAGHWQACSHCNAKGTVAIHIFSEGGKECTVCDYVKIEAKGEISFHFMMLGNDNAGDCIYIKAGENDILIDAGSRANSIDDIKNYIDAYVTDGKLEYVIVTHGDQDHIAGFAKKNGSIFDLYECETIIDFPKTTKTTETYYDYVSERDAEVGNGAKHYTALECYKSEKGGQKVYNLSDDGNIKMEILYNYFYENKTTDENDYSVCVQFVHGERKFLFTGDLEAEGEEYLIQYNSLSQVEFFKAGHHGSKTSSNDYLLDVIKPKICVACCCAGSVEYTQNLDNTFPTQAFINRISKHTELVYCPIMTEISLDDKGDGDPSNDKYENAENYTVMNGNIVVVSEAAKPVYVECSNNNTLLKDTEWFKTYRQTPSYWLD